MAVTGAARLARPRRWPAGLAWMLWALVILGLAVVAWQDHLLREAGRPDLVLFDTFAAVPVLTMVSASTAGAVLASRRPRHPVGWLLLAFGLSLTANGVAAGYLRYGLLAGPGALPAIRSVVLYYPATVFTAQLLLGFVLLLTPTGSLPSPGWRWWARAMVAALVAVLVAVALAPGLVNPRYQAANGPFDFRGLGGALLAANQAALAVTTLAVVVGAASLVVRFRHAPAVERQQLRWVALAAAPLALTVPIVVAGLATGSPGLVDELLAVCLASIPLAIAAAILRYRLYDLDRIISRTLTYGLLTVLLGGGYAGVVLGLGQLLGHDSPLVVAGATLAVAALFGPARRRTQDLVDRHFDRRRYDANNTIAAFSARLRQQIDLESLTGELLAVVEATTQPTNVSLWLRPSVSASPDQRSVDPSGAASQPTAASPSSRTAL
jgi:hypothetical protein